MKAHAEFSGQLRFLSNYVYRGYSKSDGGPIVQGNLDYEHSSGFYLGTWASMVDFGDERLEDHAHVEVTPYLGWNFDLAEDWRVDTVLTRYIFDGKVLEHSADYNEIYALLHFRDLLTGRFAVAFDAYGHGREIFNYELQTRYPLTDTLEVSASLGYEDAEQVLEYDYLYWNLGAKWHFHRNGAIDLRYYDSYHLDERLGQAHHRIGIPEIDNPIVISISVGF
jgi:uncharacterized protein (TIGR02001 family)